jgi:DNA-binding SARP family transcriptional activator
VSTDGFPSPSIEPSRRPDAREPRPARVEALVVDRLIAQLEAIWHHRLGLVVAPPGAGKSTLLTAFTRGLDVPVAWYEADRWDTTPMVLIARLAEAFRDVDGAHVEDWVDVEDVLAGIADIRAPRVLLVIDDLHAIEGTAAEAVVERIVARAPTNLHVLAASRSQPRFNVSRLRVAGRVLELRPDDLRFRTWEVERLFRDVYGDPIPPVELARLARWTEGWAAGLQLFHLATHGRTASERRAVLRLLGPRSRLANEYLAQNALDRVSDELREFLVASSVLGRLSGPLCDTLLDRAGSAMLLEELERLCLFTTRVGSEATYRYHEVFRSHLQGVLLSEVGAEGARARFLAAGDVLMANGLPAEALEAYVRAEAWDIVERLLGTEGQAIAEGPLRWLGLESQHALPDDAWLGLAGARRLRAEGRFREAVEAYGTVARESRSAAAAEHARRERSAIGAWLQPDTTPGPELTGSWWAQLRRALQRDPRSVARDARSGHDAGSRLAGGLAALAAGDLREARGAFDDLAEDPDVEDLVACVAQMARGVAALLAGNGVDGVVALNGAIGAAEGLGWEWLARVGRSLLALSGRPDHRREAGRLAETASAAGDAWGAALATLAWAWGGLDGTGAPGDGAAARAMAGLGAPVLQAWATAISALEAALPGESGAAGIVRGGSGATELVRTARAQARTALVPALEAVASLADSLLRHDESEAAGWFDRLWQEHGLRVPVAAPRAPTDSRAAAVGAVARGTAAHAANDLGEATPASLRLLGQFQLEIGGEAADLGAIRPRVRSLLQVLAMHVGASVHRETISEILWPEADPGALARNLHVAIASLRRVLEPEATRGGFRFILRDGESYRLELPAGSEVDLLHFEEAVAETRAALARQDLPGVERWGRLALERYTGDLLPEAGPAEWVVARRDGLRSQAVQVAELLAAALLERGDSAGSAAVCTAALERDRYHDPLWRTLIAAREASGDQAAARSVRAAYQRTLDELGV